jgi:hypothetical protein
MTTDLGQRNAQSNLEGTKNKITIFVTIPGITLKENPSVSKNAHPGICRGVRGQNIGPMGDFLMVYYGTNFKNFLKLQ